MLPPRLLQGPIIVFSEGYSFYFARKLFTDRASCSPYIPHNIDKSETVYLPPSGSGFAKDGKKLEYNIDEASFYWGLNVPKARFPGLDISETGDHLKVVLEAIEHWAPV